MGKKKQKMKKEEETVPGRLLEVGKYLVAVYDGDLHIGQVSASCPTMKHFGKLFVTSSLQIKIGKIPSKWYNKNFIPS